MEKGHNNRGVTLIALIVTIIVLLILAGITIGTLTSDNSIINKATDAQILSALSDTNESIELYKIKKIQNEYYSETGENDALLQDGILQEVEDKSTGRKLGIIQEFNKLGLNSKFGEGYKKIEVDDNGYITSSTELYDVYAIDLEDNTLYYIKNEQVWSLNGKNNLAETAERIKFVTEWTTQEDNQEIELPLYNTYKVMVEWGDGEETLVDNSNSESKKHTYEKAGVYNVKIRKNIEGGVCQSFSFGAYGIGKNMENRNKITKIIQWGEVRVKGINFAQCQNLKGPIPSPTDKSFINTDSFDSLFYQCTSLTGEIPKDLFKNANKASEFSIAFNGCTLEGEIPEDLFKDASNVMNMHSTFANTKNLTGKISKELFKGKQISDFYGAFLNSGINEIEEGIFDDVGESVKTFEGTFSGTKIEKIPKDLFKYNTKVINFAQVFNNCTELKGEIPEGLFATNTEATDFSYAFYNCKKLTGKIRKDIFPAETVEKEIKFQSTFMWCTGLEGIEEDAFDNYPNIINFYQTFSMDSGIKGNVPELWNRTNVTNSSLCFRGVTSASNYSDIPDEWK